jgi:hypothetical protein
MSAHGLALTLAATVAALGVATPAAHAAAPPKLHTVTVGDVEEGPFVCGDLTMTVIGGSQVERVHAVQVKDVIHFNLVRNFRDLRMRGSDGVVHRATAVTHATVLLDATLAEPQPISVREVLEVTIGGVGRLHEVIVETPDIESDTLTGTCAFAG